MLKQFKPINNDSYIKYLEIEESYKDSNEHTDLKCDFPKGNNKGFETLKNEYFVGTMLDAVSAG